MKEKREKKKAQRQLAEQEREEEQKQKKEEVIKDTVEKPERKRKNRPGKRTEALDLNGEIIPPFNPEFISAPADNPMDDKGFIDFIGEPEKKPEIKIQDGTVEATPDDLFDLMKDNDLFTRDEETERNLNLNEGSGGLGLDGGTEPRPGFGLDGGPVSEEIIPEEEPVPEEETHTLPVEKEKKPEKELTNSQAKNLSLKNGDFNPVKKKKNYKKPPLNLLDKPVKVKDRNLNSELKEKALTLEKTLQSFNVKASVVQVTRGPAVTRYEIQPDTGVKVSSIVRLADDIALNLCAKSIRIEAPIPGKAAVGIEVENEKINTVNIGEIIGSNEFKEAKSKISFAVGRDITGKSVVANLKSMPHMLIAGSTGSGKSVCINSIITSLLYKADPDEVKLVLIDPKVVELGNYNGIPHLLLPVVTDPSKAAATLNWAVAEMTKRYKSFAEEQVRDISGFNEKMDRIEVPDRRMPQVVIIIDELADLMMAAPSQVEESICRLAQMARAAGMHLIVATQRPSVDIITGVIKANIPSRIAFAVSSQVDSRTILDMGGAEKLVGKGDMLFSPLGAGKPVRVQGCFISDQEVERVIEFVKSESEGSDYAEDIMEDIDRVSVEGGDQESDELLPEAIECVVNAGKASTSMLQRRFRIGYNRGASIMDEMEMRGIIGPQDGSRPRQVLMTKEELAELKEEKEK